MIRSFLFLLLGTISCSIPSSKSYKLTADFEENEKIYIVYSSKEYITELISTLSKYEKIGILVDAKENISVVSTILKAGKVHSENITYETLPDADLWIRDSAPAILKKRNGKLRAVNFLTNPRKKLYENNDNHIANNLKLNTRSSRLIGSGGAWESNGEGTLIATESYMMRENPKLDKGIIEKELKQCYGLKNIIWLKKGLIEDELFDQGPIFEDVYAIGCGGHVDEFCRFVNENTVLLSQVDPSDVAKNPLYKVNHDRLEENYQILNSAIPKLNIVRIPAAEFIVDFINFPGDSKDYQVLLTASYLNFIIGNHVIIAAKYYEEGMPLSLKEKDAKVHTILQEAFPNREIVQINPRHLNLWGGGYHCVTFNLPAKKKKSKTKKLG